jgi:hypothetical protein
MAATLVFRAFRTLDSFTGTNDGNIPPGHERRHADSGVRIVGCLYEVYTSTIVDYCESAGWTD